MLYYVIKKWLFFYGTLSLSWTVYQAESWKSFYRVITKRPENLKIGLTIYDLKIFFSMLQNFYIFDKLSALKNLPYHSHHRVSIGTTIYIPFIPV